MSMSLLNKDNEIVQRKLIIFGVNPTNWTSPEGVNYNRINCVSVESLQGDNSFGYGATNYHYGDSTEISKFSNFNFPLQISAKTKTVTDLKGKTKTEIVELDFNSVIEIDLVPRQKVLNKDK